MKIIHEIDSLTDFEPWSYAVSRYETLTYKQLEQLDRELELLYPDGMTDTQVNDILWHDSDWVAELLGFRDWEHLERANNGETDQTYECEVKISKAKFDRINQLLAEIDFDDDSEEMEELIDELGATEDVWECGWEFKFEDGAKIFIDIRSGSSNYYDDMVWQKDDDEQLLDCNYELNEEIEFEIDDNTYICKFIIEEDDDLMDDLALEQQEQM